MIHCDDCGAPMPYFKLGMAHICYTCWPWYAFPDYMPGEVWLTSAEINISGRALLPVF